MNLAGGIILCHLCRDVIGRLEKEMPSNQKETGRVQDSKSQENLGMKETMRKQMHLRDQGIAGLKKTPPKQPVDEAKW